jgi:hypothetical protein
MFFQMKRSVVLTLLLSALSLLSLPADEWQSPNGLMEFQIDETSGGIQYWKVGDKVLVDVGEHKPAILLELDSGELAQLLVESVEPDSQEDVKRVCLKGHLILLHTKCSACLNLTLHVVL